MARDESVYQSDRGSCCNFCSVISNMKLSCQTFPASFSSKKKWTSDKEERAQRSESTGRSLHVLVAPLWSPALPHSPQSGIICEPAVGVSVSLSVHSGSSFHSQWLNCCFLSEQTRKQSLCDSKIKAAAQSGLREMKAGIIFHKSADKKTFLIFKKALSWKKLALFRKCHLSCKKAVTLLSCDLKETVFIWAVGSLFLQGKASSWWPNQREVRSAVVALSIVGC